MSLPVTTELKCPKCGHAFEITIYRSVNVTREPELRAKVMDHSIFTFICPGCQQALRLENDLLYHDMKRPCMIYLQPQGGENPFTLPTDQMPGYLLRFVTSYNQLREKILIFEEWLNDIAIEHLKRAVWAKAFPEKPITDDSIYFAGLAKNAEKETVINFHIVEAGKVLGQFQIPFKLYSNYMASADKEAVSMTPGAWKIVNQTSCFPG